MSLDLNNLEAPKISSYITDDLFEYYIKANQSDRNKLLADLKQPKYISLNKPSIKFEIAHNKQEASCLCNEMGICPYICTENLGRKYPKHKENVFQVYPIDDNWQELRELADNLRTKFNNNPRKSFLEAKLITASTLKALLYDNEYGCVHYTRKCKLICNRCNKSYYCRLCHDENESHTINRFNVKNVQCGICNTIQGKTNKCKNCGSIFGAYYCEICALYDYDTSIPIFHCNDCGICRVGNVTDYTHCNICNMCVLKTNKKHLCRVGMYQDSCAICLEPMTDSIKACQALSCLHVFHCKCIEDLCNFNGKKFVCPICKRGICTIGQETCECNSCYDTDVSVVGSDFQTEE